MGKLILDDTQEFIEEVVQTRLHSDYSTYSRFLGTAPIFVTYYKQNVIETTTDKGFGNVNHNYKETGKKYIKINNLPLWDVDKSSFELDMENGVMKADYKSDATMVPNIITPIVDDYFTIHYLDQEMTFKICDIQVDNIKSDNYFKVSFKYSSVKRHYLDRLTTETYDCIFDRIGTEEKCLLLNETVKSLKELTRIYDELVELYLDEFYDNKSNSLLYKLNDRFILYDPYLTKFVSDNRLFEKSRSSNGINILECVTNINGFNKKYIKSIFNSFIKRKHVIRYAPKFRPVRIIDLDCYFGNTARNYCQIDLSDNNPENDFLFQCNYIHFIDKKPKTDFPIIDPVHDLCDYIQEDEPKDKFIEFCRIYNDNEEGCYEKLYTFATTNFIDMYMEHDMDYYIFTILVLYILQCIINDKSNEK